MCRLLGYCRHGEAPIASLVGEDRLLAFTALSAYDRASLQTSVVPLMPAAVPGGADSSSRCA